MRSYRERHPERFLLSSAKQRARQKGLPFSLTEKDIKIGKRCPALNITYKTGVGKRPIESSPTLDRINPKRGYVPGNVVVISLMANRIKSSANARQILRVYQWLRKITKKRNISYKRFRSN
jgi:hypothetical protein